MDLSEKDLVSLAALKELIEESSCEILKNALENGEWPDEHLLRFIRSRKYDIKTAFERVKRYQEVRIKYAEFFATLTPNHHRFGIEEGGFQILKHKDPDGASIITGRASSKVWCNPEELVADNVPRLLALVGWEAMRDKSAQIHGFVNIFDCEGFCFGHAKLFTTQLIFKWVNIFIKAGPAKIKSIHLINVNPIFKATLYLIKLFLPRKIARRINMYGKPEKDFLDDFVPSAHLPEWLGGDLPDDEATDWELAKELLQREEYYQNMAKPSLDAIKKT